LRPALRRSSAFRSAWSAATPPEGTQAAATIGRQAWLARLALERDVGLEEVGIALDALDRLAGAPDHSGAVLAELEWTARPLSAGAAGKI
jgi:hypothetical protein